MIMKAVKKPKKLSFREKLLRDHYCPEYRENYDIGDGMTNCYLCGKPTPLGY